MKTEARLIAITVMALCLPAWPSDRSRAARAAFQREHPCPATDARRGACPGFVIDHVQPLCAGGADRTENMQWQTIDDAKVKDAQERRLCRDLKL